MRLVLLLRIHGVKEKKREKIILANQSVFGVTEIG
jgi:hypothetical protein